MATATAQMVEVELDLIKPNPWQPRSKMDPDGIRDLQEDILSIGRLIHEPLARPHDGCFQLAAGHRRVEAVRGLRDQGKWGSTVTLKVESLSDEEMAYIALSENRLRKNLTPAEEISAWAKVLREIPGVTVQSLADKVGVDRTTMSKNLAILDLPAGVLDLVDSGDMAVGAAQEFLALRNQDHCHEDAIQLALEDLSGETRWDSKPPDYRIKTVREAILGIATGQAAYGYGVGFDEASRSWRPLFSEGRGKRDISFDVDAFKIAHPNHIHVLPKGELTGGAAWTCDAKDWASWSTKATRDANKAAGSGAPASQSTGKKSSADAEWWKAVKRDPIVINAVGKRLRATKSPSDLTEEERAGLGTRVQQPGGDLIRLPQEAQPDGINLGDNNRAPRPPLFNFGECATCVWGASWYVPPGWESRQRPQLVCTNQQAWLDRRSVGMQAWVQWKDMQIMKDGAHDRKAIRRLMTRVDQDDARGLVRSMWEFISNPEPVKPLGIDAGIDWSERTRHHYWPAGATWFAEMSHLELPDAAVSNVKHQWVGAAEEWLRTSPDDIDWSIALACLLVWQARGSWGIGRDIWGTVGIPTVAQAAD